MKKLLLLAVLAVAAVSVMPANAGHADARSVSATITAPTAESGGAPVTRHARCAAVLGLQNDVVGHFEPLSAEEGDGTHEFSLTAGGAEDFDVVFYSNLGTCDNSPAPVTSGVFNGAGNETGTIPEDTIGAIVVFKAPGLNGAFTLSIG